MSHLPKISIMIYIDAKYPKLNVILCQIKFYRLWNCGEKGIRLRATVADNGGEFDANTVSRF